MRDSSNTLIVLLIAVGAFVAGQTVIITTQLQALLELLRKYGS